MNTFNESIKKAPAYTRETVSEQETLALARTIGGFLHAGDWVALLGELGTGKTVFAQGVGEALECHGPVSSPTFVIMKTHPPKSRAGAPFHHVDLYRLALPEVASLAWEDVLSGPGVTVVEWAEKAISFWPMTCLPIRITHRGDARRQFEFFSSNARAAELIRKIKES